MEYGRLNCNNPNTLCDVATDGYCPEQQSRHPLFTAEQLCIRSIEAANSELRLRSLTERAHNQLEIGLLVNDEGDYFDEAETLLRAAKKKASLPAYKIQMDLFLTYLPYFRQRARGEPHSPQQLSDDIGTLFLRTQKDFKEKYISEVNGVEAELLALYLLADHSPYPTTCREGNNSKKLADYNHDIYVVHKKDGLPHKIPLEIKRLNISTRDQGRYKVPVLVLGSVFLEAWQRPERERKACYLDVCRAAASVIKNEGDEWSETIVSLMKRAMWLKVQEHSPEYSDTSPPKQQPNIRSIASLF